MKAFAMLGFNKVGQIEKPIPECEPLDALLRPLALAVCTSDVHTLYEGAIGDRHELILGYKGVGQVVKVGSLVKRLKVRDKVVI